MKKILSSLTVFIFGLSCISPAYTAEPAQVVKAKAVHNHQLDVNREKAAALHHHEGTVMDDAGLPSEDIEDDSETATSTAPLGTEAPAPPDSGTSFTNVLADVKNLKNPEESAPEGSAAPTPKYPDNPLAVVNAVAGAKYVHSKSEPVPMQDAEPTLGTEPPPPSPQINMAEVEDAVAKAKNGVSNTVKQEIKTTVELEIKTAKTAALETKKAEVQEAVHLIEPYIEKTTEDDTEPAESDEDPSIADIRNEIGVLTNQ